MDLYFVIMAFSAVFLAGAAIGQTVLRYRLALLEHRNLLLEQKRLDELKKMLRSRGYAMHLKENVDYDKAVKREIDDMLEDLDRS